MSNGIYANFADTISTVRLEALFPAEMKALTDALAANAADDDNDFPTSLRQLAQDSDNDQVCFPEGTDPLDALLGAFAARFPGLRLFLRYHDGDRDDDVDGAFWDIDGLYVLSPGAQALLSASGVTEERNRTTGEVFRRSFYTQVG